MPHRRSWLASHTRKYHGCSPGQLLHPHGQGRRAWLPAPCKPSVRGLELAVIGRGRTLRQRPSHTHVRCVVMKLLAAVQAHNIRLEGCGIHLMNRRDRSADLPVVTSEQQVEYCINHVRSACRRDYFHCQCGHLIPVLPVVPCAVHAGKQS